MWRVGGGRDVAFWFSLVGELVGLGLGAGVGVVQIPDPAGDPIHVAGIRG